MHGRFWLRRAATAVWTCWLRKMSATPPSLERITVTIPAEVADFMQEVLYRIESHDETVERGSDDSIQAPNIAPIIGGVEDLDAKWFRFRYTACSDPLTWWIFDLFDNEIEDIAKRRVTSLAMWRCSKCARHLFRNKSDVFCECNP